MTILESASGNVWSLAMDMLFSPAQAVQRVALRKRTLFFSLIAFSAAFTSLWMVYYRDVDFDWLRNFLADMAVRMHPGFNASQVRHGMESMTLPMLLTSALIAGQAAMILEILARTVYHFLIASMVSEREVHFSKWFALVCWSTLPMTLMLLLALANLCFIDSSRLPPSQVSLSSLNATLLHLSPASSFSLWASAIDLSVVWTIGITAVGMSTWLGIGRIKALTLSALPYAVYFGIWALIIL